MNNFKKMVLMDHDEFLKQNPVNNYDQKVFEIEAQTPSIAKLSTGDELIKTINKKKNDIERQMKNLLRNKKINDQDKILFFNGLLTKLTHLNQIKITEEENENKKFLKSITDNVESRLLAKKKLNEAKDEIESSAIKPKNEQISTLNTLNDNQSSTQSSEYEIAQDVTMTEEDLEKNLSKFEKFTALENPLLTNAVTQNTPIRGNTKRRAVTPLSTAVKRKKIRNSENPKGIIKTWTLRPRLTKEQINLIKREIIN